MEDLKSILELAHKYEKQAKSNKKLQVGESISVEDFFKELADDTQDPELEKKIYELYLKAANLGDSDSACEVARRLYDGIGVEKDGDAATNWYLKAAEGGCVSAMHVVAFRADDDEIKFKWYFRAAELGEPDSIKQVAIMYAAGKGTVKDENQTEYWLAKIDEKNLPYALYEIARETDSLDWLKRAAESSVPAQIYLAEKYIEDNDFENALNWYGRAAEGGDFDSWSIIGDIYYIGEGNVAQDYKKAVQYYGKAAALGHNMAAVKLALMYYNGRGVKQDLNRAFEMFQKTANKFEQFARRINSVAKFYLAKMIEEEYFDDEKAFKWYKRAAAIERMFKYESCHDVALALYKVAETYFMQENFSKAIAIYEQLANKSYDYPYNFMSAKKLIWIYELGEGVPKDSEKAQQWRQKLDDYRK